MSTSLGLLLQIPVVGVAWSAGLDAARLWACCCRSVARGGDLRRRAAAARLLCGTTTFYVRCCVQHECGNQQLPSSCAGARRLLRGAGAPERGAPRGVPPLGAAVVRCAPRSSGCSTANSSQRLEECRSVALSAPAAPSSVGAMEGGVCSRTSLLQQLRPHAPLRQARQWQQLPLCARTVMAVRRRRLSRALKNRLEPRGDAALRLLFAHRAAHQRALDAPAGDSRCRGRGGAAMLAAAHPTRSRCNRRCARPLMLT